MENKKFSELVAGDKLYIKNIDLEYINSEITSISKDTARNMITLNTKFETYHLEDAEKEIEFLEYSYSDTIATSMDRLLLETMEG